MSVVSIARRLGVFLSEEESQGIEAGILRFGKGLRNNWGQTQFYGGRPAAQEGWRELWQEADPHWGAWLPRGVGLPLPRLCSSAEGFGFSQRRERSAPPPAKSEKEESELRLAALIRCRHCKLRSVHAQVRSAGRASPLRSCKQALSLWLLACQGGPDPRRPPEGSAAHESGRLASWSRGVTLAW